VSEDELAEVRSAVAVCRKYLGCGDGSCIFVSPSGMTTNGGCQCSTKRMGMAAFYTARTKRAVNSGGAL